MQSYMDLRNMRSLIGSAIWYFLILIQIRVLQAHMRRGGASSWNFANLATDSESAP